MFCEDKTINRSLIYGVMEPSEKTNAIIDIREKTRGNIIKKRHSLDSLAAAAAAENGSKNGLSRDS